jgi:hypothetical protein
VSPLPATSIDGVASALAELARIASALIDGDEARRTITRRAYFYATDPYPQHIYMAGDQLDFDLARHDRLKKFLLRLETLAGVRCNAGVWVRMPGAEERVTVVCHNGSLHRWYRFGESARPLEPEMRACAEAGAVVVARPTAATPLVTALGPIRDSLEDIVGFIELTARDPTAAGEGPAWS